MTDLISREAALRCCGPAHAVAQRRIAALPSIATADEIIRLREALERVRRFALAGEGVGFDLILSVADQSLRTQDEGEPC